jgi:regulatory protein
VQLLAVRPHFRRQLALKLAGRGYPHDEVEEALERLTAHGYLNDAVAARDYAAARLRRGEGRVRVLAELLARGCAKEAAEEAVAALAPEDDSLAAREAAERWRRRGGADLGALARHLQRKGFSARAIVSALQWAGAEGGDLDLP